jgi:hypothetical protein
MPSFSATSARRLATQGADHRAALFPATLQFQSAPGQASYTLAFAEVENEGQLHESGQGIQNNRLAAVEWPIIEAYTPGLLHTFEVTAATYQPHLVGQRFRIMRITSAPGSPHLKLTCTRIET